MKNPRFLLPLVLTAVVVAACATATSTVAPAQPKVIEPTPTLPPAVDAVTQATSSPTETAAPTVLPVATSRGLDLHATDPSTVNLASGGLQLVEFFRFT